MSLTGVSSSVGQSGGISAAVGLEEVFHHLSRPILASVTPGDAASEIHRLPGKRLSEWCPGRVPH